MGLLRKNSFCSYCGREYEAEQAWPRTCGSCSNITYLNPLPVGVCLLPVGDGLLCVRRGIEPGYGELALPGGFLDVGETWQEGCVRELREETGIDVPASTIQLFELLSMDSMYLLVFGLLPPMRSEELPAFLRNEETLGCEVITQPIELAFSTHTQVMRDYFQRRGFLRA